MTESVARSFPPFDPTRPVAVIGAGVMGAKVAWATARAGIDPTDRPPVFLDQMIAEGRGFYRKPDPEYRDPDWLTAG